MMLDELRGPSPFTFIWRLSQFCLFYDSVTPIEEQVYLIFGDTTKFRRLRLSQLSNFLSLIF